MTLFERHKYINMTTFRKSGKAVPTAVWFVELDGKLYTFTGEQTGKAKRVRANGKADIAPCDARGNPVGDFVSAKVRIVKDTMLVAQAEELYRKKYGLSYRLMTWFNWFRRSKTGDYILLETSLG